MSAEVLRYGVGSAIAATDYIRMFPEQVHTFVLMPHPAGDRRGRAVGYPVEPAAALRGQPLRGVGGVGGGGEAQFGGYHQGDRVLRNPQAEG